ncbi:hypothetical protein [Bacteroides sp.]|uniref:hypothetical protein n=1 Tax=Bacteroides sp. TaxID=29523 RepID=UPI002621AF20|nr:hypothetical protein [Bacteroides sp.]MDD3038826.1 hypothetical protein [Bacteroides sp.]
MDYILRGNDKDVANVLKEQRIRIGRGVISFTPISECGLITEEDARRTLEDKLAEKDEKINELTSSNEAKDKSIESMEARIAELEASATTDSKILPAGDSKELPVEDSKGVDVVEADNKNLPPTDEKKVVKRTTK